MSWMSWVPFLDKQKRNKEFIFVAAYFEKAKK